MSMVAYHGDECLKEQVLGELAEHRRHDRIIQGYYWNPEEDHGEGEGYKGCAVGCLVKDPEGGHNEYEIRFGIPEELAYLEDYLFEQATVEDAMEWPMSFMSAIPVGADLSGVCRDFIEWAGDTYGKTVWFLQNRRVSRADLLLQHLLFRTKTPYGVKFAPCRGMLLELLKAAPIPAATGRAASLAGV